MDSPKLTDLQNRAQRRYDQDGAMETVMGLGFLLSGLGMASGSHVGAFTPVFLVPIVLAWRRRITYPRLGYAAFVEKRRGEFLRGFLPIALAVIALMILVIIAFDAAGTSFPEANDTMARYQKIAIGLILSALIASIAALRRLSHLYVVAGLMMALFVGAVTLRISAGYAVAVTGAVMFAIGMVRLVRFLRDNPKLEGA
jgi:hypothetical protein